MKSFVAYIVLLFVASTARGAGHDSIPVKKVPLVAAPASKNVIPIKIRCYARGSNTAPTPLLIVDGLPFEFDKLNELNPNDIVSIDILKEMSAAAIYTCRAPRGVIIVVTKSGSAKKLIIKDFLTGDGISFATARFISGIDTVNAIADDHGIVVADQLKPGLKYDLMVSSVGYKTFMTSLNGREQEILLERNVQPCPDVEIFSSIKRIICSRMVSNRLTKDSVIASTFGNVSTVVVYPNPVRRNSVFYVRFNSDAGSRMRLNIFSLNGSLVGSQQQSAAKGLNRFSIMADDNWAAGLYIVCLENEDGAIVKQEKLIVQ